MKYAQRILSFLFVFFFLTSATSISAISPAPDRLLRVSPVILTITLSPGKTTVYAITLENLTDTPLPLLASLEGFDAADEDGAVTFSPERDTAPLTTWVRINESELLLKPREKKETTLTVVIPKDVAVGGYYAVLFFTPMLPTADTRHPQIVPKVGVLLLGNVGVQDQHGSPAVIPAFHFGALFQEKNPVDMLLRVKNVSLAHFSAKPVLLIQPLFASEQVVDLPEKIILPGKIRRWQDGFTLTPGNRILYRVSLLVSTGDGRQLKQETVLLLFPWKKTVLIFLLSALLFRGIRSRARIRNAIRAFFSS